MFNFNGPPRYLQQGQLGSAQLHPNSSSSSNNHNGTKTRISVSDMGLNTLKHQHHHHQANGHANFQSPSHSQSRNNSVSLPPIKTKSLTAAPTTRLGRPPPDEPKKRPNHREMITLTLKHVQSARGLNFEQLSSFIRGAFELPKSSALDSTLNKTLSNMVSRGHVVQIPGLGPYDACYQLAEAPDRGLDLSVRGRSVQEIPSLYPTGYSLPNGKNLVCRTAQKQPDLNMEMMGDGFGRDMNPYRRNPLTTKLDPMPYMPMADPMICQSFGQRNRIVTAGEQRPNSPNLDDQFTTLATTTATTMLGYPRDPEFHCNYECHDNYSLEAGLWTPVLPKDDDDDNNNNNNNDEDIGENSKDEATTNNTKCDELNENQEASSNSKPNPYSNINQSQSQVPSLLDTFTESCTLEEFYQSGDEDEEEEEHNQNKTKNFSSTEDMKKKNEYSLNFVEEKRPTDSKINNKINTFSSMHSLENNKLSRLASHRYLQNKMLTTKKSSGVPCKTSKNGRIQVDDEETDPLENFDVFASYGGVETKKEFESNNRSCQIMNDFSQKAGGSDNMNLNEHEFENRMDYLYGLADIIDTYKEPLNLRPVTDKTSSKSKTYRKSNQ